MIIRSKKGFSLLEIIVAATLFVLIVAGMANVFVAAKRWLAHSRFKMTSGELGKYFLEPLQVNVKQSDWSSASGDYVTTNPLYIHTWTDSAVSPGGKSYTPNYTVGAVPAPGVGSTSPPQMRKVKVQVQWYED